MLRAQETGKPPTEDLLPIQIQLIWGTNNEKQPDDPRLKELNAQLLERLRAFKWDYYYEVARRNVVLNRETPQKIKVSEKCFIYAEYKGNKVIRVKFYGEKKLVWKGEYHLKPELPLAIAGDDKNENVWFVLVSLREEFPTDQERKEKGVKAKEAELRVRPKEEHKGTQ